MNQRAGIFYAVTAYVMWGFFPLFWHLLGTVPPVVVLAHRIMWSLFFLLIVLKLTNQIQLLVTSVKSKPLLKTYGLSGFMIAINWLVYVYAVQSGHVMESSLGYFINPLLNIFVGMIVFKERLSKLQWLAMSIAMTGVLFMTVSLGRFPWVALTLAVTFSIYGMTRKRAPLPSLVGSSLETLLLLPMAIGMLIYQHYQPQIANETSIYSNHILFYLFLGGTVTILPLLCFSEAAKRLQFSSLGFIQYLAPSLQFICAVWFFHEPYGWVEQLTFGLIWIAIAIFIFDLWQRSDRQRPGLADKTIS